MHPPNGLSYAAIFDDLSCGFNGVPFLAMVMDCYSLFLFTHLINKGQPSIVRIAEKKMKLCFLCAAEQRCSKKKKRRALLTVKKKAWPSGSSVRFAVGRVGLILGRAIPKTQKNGIYSYPA